MALQSDSRGSSDWQLKYTNLKQRTAYLLKSELWSDCTFLVGLEEEVVMAHKVVLSIASPVFAAMFYGEMAPEKVIHIPDIKPDTFRAILRYIYIDDLCINMDPLDEQDLTKRSEYMFGLFYGAKKYMLTHLEQECIKYLMAILEPKIACIVLQFANFFEEKELVNKCVQMITTNTKEVLCGDSFENTDLATAVTIFSLEHLDIDSELELFDAAVRYSKKMTPIKIVPSKKNVTCNTENLPETKEKEKLTIRSLIENIRFLTLTSEQFAEGPAQSSLLTESEAFAVLMNITIRNGNNTPMPSGFSASRLSRKFSNILEESPYKYWRIQD